eukprot:g6194.t1
MKSYFDNISNVISNFHTEEVAGVAQYCSRTDDVCTSSWTEKPWTVAELKANGLFSGLMHDNWSKFLSVGGGHGSHFTSYVNAGGPLVMKEVEFFDCRKYIDFNNRYWEVPALAILFYFALIFFLQRYMEGRKPVARSIINPILMVWNVGLSVFSMCGAFATVPTLLSMLNSHGFRPSVCRHTMWYGNGVTGLFVCLFIYSKLFELFDTVFLILKKRPVIFLHWYHHSTVLLYCWHSYAEKVSHGLWFAAMNYTVHSIMYFYFALMVSPTARKYVRKINWIITLLQLAQMIVGISVTLASIYFADDVTGLPCHVQRTNSALGLGMYVSYFLLFFVFFIRSYCWRKDSQKSLMKNKNGKEVERLMNDLGSSESKGGFSLLSDKNKTE